MFDQPDIAGSFRAERKDGGSGLKAFTGSGAAIGLAELVGLKP